MRPPGRLVLLAVVLAGAAALRFTGLGWGLRQLPDQDERPFVENAARMAARHDLDHRYYQYPGLLFELLAPAVAWAHPGSPGPSTYLAARAVVAGFGLLSVALSYLLATRLGSPTAGLVAAALVAVSPLEVFNAHEVKPDVVLETFCLLGLLAFRRVGERAQGDALAGAAVGAATAVKFSGILLAPSYVVSRLIAPGPRLGRLILAGTVSLVVFALLSPYLLLHATAAGAGIGTQLRYHYEADAAGGALRYSRMILIYLGTLVRRGLGLPAAVLVLLAPVLCRRGWRSWLPTLVLPLTLILVFATADVKHDRFLLPGLGAAAVLAGLGLASIGRTWPRLALALAALLPLPSLLRSVNYVREIASPSPRDRALDWLAAEAPAGASVLNGVPGLGIDRSRYAVLAPTGSPTRDRVLATNVDFVLAPPPLASLGAPWAPDFLAVPAGAWTGPAVAGVRVPVGARPRYRSQPLAAGSLDASEARDQLPNLIDGDPSTGWRSEGPQRPGLWVEVRLDAPVRVGRVILDLGTRPGRYGRALDVLVPGPDASWRRLVTLDGRPPVEEQIRLGDGLRQILLLLRPATTDRLRLVEGQAAEHPWGFAELHVDSVD